MRIPITKLYSKTWIDEVMTNNPMGIVTLVFDDTEVNIHFRTLIVLRIIWMPYVELNYKIAPEDVFFDGIDVEMTNNIAGLQTLQKERILKTKMNVDMFYLSKMFFDTVSYLQNFQFIHCRSGICSISGSSFYHLLKDPKLAELASHTYPDEEGTPMAEARLKTDGDELLRLLNSDIEIKNNPLRPFLKTGSLKDNMLPQVMLAFGTRDDINGRMINHTISESSISGMKSLRDMATESVAAKKAANANKNNVSTVQYGARKLKLSCATLRHLHTADCGSNMSVDIIPKPEHLHNYIYKIVKCDGVYQEITKVNYKSFANKLLTMRSPMLCGHPDGICDACCAYRNNELSKWLPENIHIGQFAGSLSGEIVAQLVLSTKHLTKTYSGRFMLSEPTREVFDIKLPNKILFKKESRLKEVILQIPADTIGPLIDIHYNDSLPEAETFSKLTDITILEIDNTRMLSIHEDPSAAHVYMSPQLLSYIKRKECTIVDNILSVDLSNWNVELPIFEYALYNDDIVGRAKRLESYLATQLRNDTSLSTALYRYSELVYAKLSIPIVYLEMILKCFLVADYNDARIPPAVNDPDDVTFMGRDKLIAGRAISTQFAYENNMEFITTPSAYGKVRDGGIYDPLYGIL